MSNGQTVQIPRNLLFRYRLTIPEVPGAPIKPSALGESHRLAAFGRFEGQAAFASWRCGWSAAGLYFNSEVRQKKMALWCRPQSLLESDSLQLWIDTRATQNVHRATRYCHWFLVLPTGSSPGSPPLASMLKINRAKEDSPAINRGKLQVERQLFSDGYSLSVFIPAVCLNGWDPAEHSTLGLFVATLDREFGWQTLGVGADLPFAEDPSLWCSARLGGEVAIPATPGIASKSTEKPPRRGKTRS